MKQQGKRDEDSTCDRAILEPFFPLAISWFAATLFPGNAGNVIVPELSGTKQQYFSCHEQYQGNDLVQLGSICWDGCACSSKAREVVLEIRCIIYIIKVDKDCSSCALRNTLQGYFK